jgi:hypothetical protein
MTKPVLWTLAVAFGLGLANPAQSACHQKRRYHRPRRSRVVAHRVVTTTTVTKYRLIEAPRYYRKTTIIRRWYYIPEDEVPLDRYEEAPRFYLPPD